MNNSNYIFFYGGILSQWSACKFTVQGIDYNCAEQYMMAEKADMFRDFGMFNAIMQTDDPAKQKAYGKQVANFDKKRWEESARDIVFNGNMAKFSQNPAFKEYLLSTGEKKLVEASPYDKIWGIGLAMTDPRRFDENQWQGTNWLGEVLMRVRIALS